MTAVDSLRNLLPENCALLIYNDANIRWLTGFYTDNGCVCITKNSAVLFTDSRYSEAASRVITSMHVLDSNTLTKDAGVLCQKEHIQTIYIEQSHTTLSLLVARKSMLDSFTLIFDNTLDTWITKLRSVKTEEELNALRTAQKITDDGFSYILNQIAPGRTEKEVALDLEFYMRKQGAEAVSFDFIVVSGKNGSLPHGVPSDKKIENGDLVTLDFGAVYGGMHADMTRTVGLGSISDEQKQIYAIVLEAQETCLRSLKSGMDCTQADAIARDVIKQAGYGDYFSHSTGHGVGFEIHESPNLSPKSTFGPLQAGNVVTVEPGIYIPGKCGVRIEDMALIREDGIEDLTHSKKSLICL